MQSNIQSVEERNRVREVGPDLCAQLYVFLAGWVPIKSDKKADS